MERYELPADLSLLTYEQVCEQETLAVAEFNRVNSEETPVTPDNLEYGRYLAAAIEKIRPVKAGHETRIAQEAQNAQAALAREQAELAARVNGPAEPAEPAAEGATPEPAAPVDLEAVTAAAARGTTEGLLALMDDSARRRAGLTVRDRPQAPTPLSMVRGEDPPRGDRAVLTASVNIPGRAAGERLTSIEDVIKAFNKTAKTVRTTHDGYGQETIVCTLENRFEHTLDDRTTQGQIDTLLHDVVQNKSNQEALVAGGGWCSPSETRYDFFNVACADGMVDLPTFGVTRGGVRFPTSPSLADAVFTVTGTQAGVLTNQNLAGFGATFSSASMPWVWTETDDIATVTGAPNKPTLRVPCPGFNDVRLECYGVNLTAGNLTDDAYPEATANTLRLLNSAHDHVINARYIAAMLALSSAAITISGGGNRPAFNQVLSGLDLAATDYRAKFAMCEEDVIEVVAPFWVKDVIVADLAYRTNVELLSVAESAITGYFADRNIRVQWVNDWQVRASGTFGNPAALPGGALTAWPTQANFMLYAAGTFIRGNGLTLDLGIIRDSVLNAENDHTVAFTEECHLIARVGHESRLYTIGFVVNGAAVAAQTLGAYI